MIALSFGCVSKCLVLFTWGSRTARPFWPSESFLCRYAQYGDVSSKIDVYAFGVVLYELISSKEAIVRTNEPENESKGLVALVVFLGPS